jgi:surfactin synthase thioesterase subunit
MRVMCLPPAGAGPSFFHHWRAAAAVLELVPLDLPAREKRLLDEPIDSVPALVEDLLPQAFAAAPDVVLGHSFGAVVAFELSRRLTAAGRAVQLVVSGAAAPDRLAVREISHLPDAAFVEAVRDVTGYRHDAMNDPELLDLILPPLRADMRAFESYRPDPGRLDAPILALRGADDDLVSAVSLAGWSPWTTRGLSVRECPGGHMYLVDQYEALLTHVRSATADANQ